jgi:hypothetical protein
MPKFSKGADYLAFLTEFNYRRKINGKRESLLVHGLEKFFVGLGSVHFVEQKFHRINDAKLRQNLA